MQTNLNSVDKKVVLKGDVGQTDLLSKNRSEDDILFIRIKLVKMVFNERRKRKKYYLNMTKNLYFIMKMF